MRSASDRIPGLLLEMRPSLDQIKLINTYAAQLNNDVGVLNCDGPILNRAIHRFAAKFGFALHFKITGEILPAEGGVSTWWFTNHQALQGDIPKPLIDQMGPPDTLRQGRWEVSDQFKYSSLATPDGLMSAHFATFRFSFAICAFASVDRSKVLPPGNGSHVITHSPGWLREV